MKLTHKRGRLVMALHRDEIEVLDTLLEQLQGAVRSEDFADPVVARLFPSAYVDDVDAEVEYRDLTESALRTDRSERIAGCAGDLAAGPDIDITEPEAATRWIQVLNDLRLAIGTRLGVTEDTPEADPDDPVWKGYPLYLWLTQTQDKIVTALLE